MTSFPKLISPKWDLSKQFYSSSKLRRFSSKGCVASQFLYLKGNSRKRKPLIFKPGCAVFFLIFLLSCDAYTKRPQEAGKVDFSTSDASELFFHNVRQIYYDLENQEATKLKLYRKKDRNRSQHQPVINLILVENWRYDEAYLLLEPNSVIGPPSQIHVLWTSQEGETGSYRFENANKEGHFLFAYQLYHSILKKHQLFFQAGDKKTPLFLSNQEQESFRIVMEDYLRLIGKE